MSSPSVFHPDLLVRQASNALASVGVDEVSRDAATRAMLHASLHGIDSHGFRLTATYCAMVRGRQVNPTPTLKFEQRGPSAMLIDADGALGHYPSFAAMERACSIARETGVGAVGVFGSTHNGAAGTYALAGAEAGCFALSMTNADAAVALHGAAAEFHGTNPIAAAAPVPNSRPWLLDMATSSIPLNRVFLYRVLGIELPENVAADKDGVPTRSPAHAEMLIPLGGSEFGFKGAGLAGLVTILCAVLTGAALDPAMPRMSRTETYGRRNCGHFFLAIDPALFAGADGFGSAMLAYLSALRDIPARQGESVMAPGDREWAVAKERAANGIPIDPDTVAFLSL